MKMMGLKLAVMAAVILNVIGCGEQGLSVSGDAAGSCDVRKPSNPFCYDYERASSAAVVADAIQGCAIETGSWSDALCSHQDSLGGCSTDVSSTSGTVTRTFWTYSGAGVTTAEVMSGCTSLSGEFVNP